MPPTLKRIIQQNKIDYERKHRNYRSTGNE